MYLKNIHIENNGPLEFLSLSLPFCENGEPKPIVLVGGNGSGKTNLLSIIADALFEAAAQSFTDIVPDQKMSQRPYFRVVGSSTIKAGRKGGFTILEFVQDEQSIFFHEKAGKVDASDAKERLPDSLKAAANWPQEENVKKFKIKSKQAKSAFEEGVHVYFPASRAEIPHWLNRDSVPDIKFKIHPRLAQKLDRPIYVERGLEQFKQWLMSLLVDIRMDFAITASNEKGELTLVPIGQPLESIIQKTVWDLCNRIFKAILGRQDAKIVWLGRKSGTKLGIELGDGTIIRSLDALSAGQATLLSIFGTLIRYGDMCNIPGPPASNAIQGICLIDEIDAHMHVDLQRHVVPALVKLFPKIQFIISTHSPLFVLGMEQEFGAEGVAIIELPTGNFITAESYSEFGQALEALRETREFSKAVAEAASKPGKPLVLLEGETDSIYIGTAAELLKRTTVLEKFEIDWVGAKDPKGKQGFNTGSGGLNNTYNALRANPNMMARSVVLIYDNDTNKPIYTDGKLFVCSVPGKAQNERVNAGIESLLPQKVFTEDFIEEKTHKKENGTITTTQSIKKMKLCKFLCEEKREQSVFKGFEPLLDMLDGLAQSIASASKETNDKIVDPDPIDTESDNPSDKSTTKKKPKGNT